MHIQYEYIFKDNWILNFVVVYTLPYILQIFNGTWQFETLYIVILFYNFKRNNSLTLNKQHHYVLQQITIQQGSSF